ncbi:MAG: flagellar hook-basal body complex protein [Sphingomonas sp.]
MSASERRLEVAAHNVANVSTPGFKRQIGFAQLLSAHPGGAEPPSPQIFVRRDFAQGVLSATANPLDLAISGGGFFRLRAGDAMIYSRQGQFRLAADGTLVTPAGPRAPAARRRRPGARRPAQRPSSRTALCWRTARRSAGSASTRRWMRRRCRPVGESHFAAAEEIMELAPDAVLRQGMIENSNVSLGDEMVETMAALRQSEVGSRLVQVYDDLLGRALSSLGQAGR